MRYFDCHSHFSTEAGLHHATREDYEQAQRVFKRRRTFQTEEEMAHGFRSRGVRTILDIYRTWRFTDEDEIRKSHDYVIDFARKNPDVVYGNWVAINPSMKGFWLKEFRRLLDSKSARACERVRTRCIFRPATLFGTRSTSCRLNSVPRCSS